MTYNNSNILEVHRNFDHFLNNKTDITGIQSLKKSLDLIEDHFLNEDDHAEKKRLMNILGTYINRFLNECKEICKIQNYDPDSLEMLKKSIELIRSYGNPLRSKLKPLKLEIDETYNTINNAIPKEDERISLNQIVKYYYKLSEEEKGKALPLLKALGINPYLFKYRTIRYEQKSNNIEHHKTKEKIKEDNQDRAVFSDKRNVYEYRIGGSIAKMVIKGGSYIILKGSTAIKENKPSMPESSRQKKIELVSLKKMILKENDLYTFTENVSFSSPSMASGVISGTSTNGWLCFNIK
jgi:hypothetical protein